VREKAGNIDSDQAFFLFFGFIGQSGKLKIFLYPFSSTGVL
jgi:hypothetical protein